MADAHRTPRDRQPITTPHPPTSLHTLRHSHHSHHHRIANIRKITHAEQFYPELERDSAWVNHRGGSPMGSRADAQRREASQSVVHSPYHWALGRTSSRPSPDARGCFLSSRGDGDAAQACLKELKFGIGDGHLQYYMYNWRCPSIKSSQVGLVLL